MPRDFCVYGHLAGLDKAQMRACTTFLQRYEREYPEAGVLDFLHEGHFLDVESDLEGLAAMLGAGTRGVIDVINHQDWEMHRYTLKGGTFLRKRIALDNALDTAYASERKS